MTGDGQVERVEIAQVDKQFQPIPGTERILEADTVCLAVGLNPMTGLVWTAGCKFCFIPAFPCTTANGDDCPRSVRRG